MLYFKKLNSTNDYLKEHVDELDNFECVYADEQLKGRGRTGHTWESFAKKNAMFSILVKEKEIIDNFNLVSIVTGVTIANFLDVLGLKNVSLKWPNDVYVDSKKICGILLEGSIPDYIIIGIGLNVNQTVFKHFEATSIQLELGDKFDIKTLIFDLHELIVHNYRQIAKYGPSFIKEYEEYDFLKDKEISFIYNGEERRGIAKGIDTDGSLKVLIDKNLIKINSNEVNLIRPE